MRVRYKKNRMVQFCESECLTTVPREPPPVLTGHFERCADCPYPGHGFVCWRMDKETCLVPIWPGSWSAISLLVLPGSFRWGIVVLLLSISRREVSPWAGRARSTK